MFQIADILPRYTQLNTIVAEVSNKLFIEFAQQQFVVDFYTQFNNIQPFETMLIELTMHTNAERYKTLIESLSNEIQNNIRQISSNSIILDNLNIDKVCEIYYNQYKMQIDSQLHVTQKHWKELSEINNTLDAIGFRAHTEFEEKQLWDKHKRLTDKYNSELAILNELYEQQKIAQKTVNNYHENCFPKILLLSHKLNEVSQKYLPKTSSILNEGIFFDMATVSAVHSICNKTVFENISETDFYTAINLLSSEKIIRLKQGEKIRACYLIYKLFESIQSDDKTSWRISILENLDIDERYYKSKYKEPISEDPSRKSERFAKRINEIFK